jgi:hypothetical protein
MTCNTPSTILAKNAAVFLVGGILLPLLVWTTGAMGQVITGTITGAVIDSSGGLVAGAKVTVTHVETNRMFTFVTGDSGEFTAPLLTIGIYTVSAVKDGFKMTEVPDVQVTAGSSARVNLRMEVGGVSEKVEVRDASALLQIDSAQVGNAVEGRLVHELPVEGRDILRLATLGPGVVQGQTNSIQYLSGSYLATSMPTIAGGRLESTSFTLGGINANNRRLNVPVEKPALDAVEEFSVLANNYSAEYGQGDGQVVVEFRSGTNSYHGSAYEYLRNDALNARGFFDKTVALLRYNQFGGTFGGKIRKDKTFFFTNYEGTRNPASQTQGGVFPTADMLKGNFSNFRDSKGNVIAIYDPLTTNLSTGVRQQFTGNIIPPARISSIATNLAGLYKAPVPTTLIPGASNNVLAVVPNKFTVDQTSVKIDHYWRQKDVFSSRYSFTDPRSFAGNITESADNTTDYRNQIFGQTWTHTFTPRLLNEFRAGYVRQRNVNIPPLAASQDLQKAAGFTNPLPYNFIPTVFFNSSNGTPSFNQWNGVSAGGGGEVQQTFQFVDNLSFTKGTHSLKFGGDLRRRRWDTVGVLPAGGGSLRNVGIYTAQLQPDTATSGNITPTPGTGSPVADFLLGQLTGADFGVGLNIFSYRDIVGSWFAGDTWRVTPKLTLTAGLRWDYQSPIMEKHGRESWFVYDQRCPLGCLTNDGKFGGIYDPIVNPYPGEETIRPGGIDPDYDNFGPRISVAYRLFDRTVIRGGYGLFYSLYGQNNFPGATNPPFGSGYLINSSVNDTSNPITPFLQNSAYQLNTIYPTTQPVGQTKPGTLGLGFYYDIYNVTPELHDVSFAIQHALSPDLSVEVGYMGAFGRHLSNFTSINPCTTTPCTRDPVTNVNIRKYPNFSSVSVVMTAGLSDYNAGYLKVNKRLAHGLSVLGSWTWSRDIATGGDSEGNDIFLGSSGGSFNYGQLTRHLSVLDATHRVVISGLYELPLGRGKQFGSSISKPVDLILGGWETSWITSFQSGTALDLSSFNQNQFKPGDGPKLKRMDFRSTGYFFDTSLFQAPPGGDPIPYTNFRGAGINNWDMSLFKRFAITEKHRLEFRADFYNAWNHGQFETPGHVSTLPGFGQFQARNPAYFEFGARPPRNIQLGLRYQF